MGDTPLILRAAWVLPINSAPLREGEVVIQGDTIVEVRPRRTPAQGEVIDFGEAIILPGLVNLHTHLELTVLRGAIEDLPFFAWLRRLVELKSLLEETEWLDSALWGAMEAAAAGITTLADTTDSGATVQAMLRVGLRGRVYQEVFAIQPEQTREQTLEALHARMQHLHRITDGSLVGLGIAPHAPYTVRLDSLYALRQYAQQKGYPVCIHAAESEEEVALLQQGRGAFAQMYQQRGIPWDVPNMHPMDLLERGGWLDENTLLVHAVQTTSRHAQLLADTRTAVAHCPQSNAKLYHGVAPLEDWLGRGVRVGLGTDSVVSNNTLDLFHEMRFAVLVQRAVHRTQATITAQEVVEMATLGGARALGMEEQIGSIEPGKQADLCVVSLRNVHLCPSPDPYAALVFATQANDVVMTMVAGRIVYRGGEYPLLGEPTGRVYARVSQTAQRIQCRLPRHVP